VTKYGVLYRDLINLRSKNVSRLLSNWRHVIVFYIFCECPLCNVQVLENQSVSQIIFGIFSENADMFCGPMNVKKKKKIQNLSVPITLRCSQ
jgi:hypothetical protein